MLCLFTFCQDFDECGVQNGGCSDTCENTVGSFYCKCPRGRQLKSRLTCEGKEDNMVFGLLHNEI